MKKLWIGLLAAGSVFAIDEYKSIDKGAIELDLGYTYKNVSNLWDADGESQDYDEDFTRQTILVQGKYGITAELDLEIALNYQMLGGGEEDLSGIDRPEVGLKYTMPNNIGFYLNVVTPLGSEDIVTDEPTTTLGLGFLHWLEADKFVMASQVSYDYSLEDGNKNQAKPVLGIFLKPGYLVNDQTEINLGVNFDYKMESKFDGNGNDDAGHLLTLRPGVQYMIDEKMAIEAIGTYDVMGKNELESGWSANFNFYYNI